LRSSGLLIWGGCLIRWSKGMEKASLASCSGYDFQWHFGCLKDGRLHRNWGQPPQHVYN